MEKYHKINAPFKRHLEGPLKGKFIDNEWSMPEFEYLKDCEWEFTEKIDGTNIRVHLHRYEDSLFITYGGRTDNAVIPPKLLGYLEKTFPTYPTSRRNLNEPAHRVRHSQIGRWMVDNDLTDVTLYGEGYGPGIQNGGNYGTEQKFVLFDVMIGGLYLNRDNVNDIAHKLDIDAVPVVGRGSLEDGMHLVSGWTYYDLKTGYNVEVPPLKSQWGDFTAEGVIAVPSIPLYNRMGERIITKIKVKDFT